MPADRPRHLRHVLICGLGSIGRRHLGTFRRLGVDRVDAYRTHKATLGDAGQPAPDRTYTSLAEALAEGPQAVVVANPTSLHLATARAAVAAGAHVLVEKPLSDSVAGCEDLLRRAAAAGLEVAVGCNLRFHPLLRELRRWLSDARLGRPLLARAHFGAYLPAWHPWEDYRQSYAARADLGGGVTLTHAHEIDYLLWLFGPVDRVAGACSELRPLHTEVDEMSAAVLVHRGGTLSTLSLSFCQQPPSRRLDVAFEGGTASLDLLAHRLAIDSATAAEPVHRSELQDFSIDETYDAQARAFAERVGGGESRDLCDGREALRDLEVAARIREGES